MEDDTLRRRTVTDGELLTITEFPNQGCRAKSRSAL